MERLKEQGAGITKANLSAADNVEINRYYLLSVTEKISTDSACRYPQLTLRIFIHLLAVSDQANKIALSTRHLSKKLGVNYDTATKCLKYLRLLGIIRIVR